MSDVARAGLFKVIALTMALAAGCSLLNPQSNSASNFPARADDEGSSSIIKSPGSDPKGEFETVAKNFLSVGSFRSRTTSSVTLQGREAEPERGDLDYVRPDRYRFKYGIDPEKIVIGKDTYVKKGEKWTKTADDGESQLPGVRDAFSDEVMGLIDKVQYLGEETQNGETLLRYSISGKTLGDRRPEEWKLWVFKKTALPAKFEIDRNDDLSISVIEIDYSYPPDLKIEAPV